MNKISTPAKRPFGLGFPWMNLAIFCVIVFGFLFCLADPSLAGGGTTIGSMDTAVAADGYDGSAIKKFDVLRKNMQSFAVVVLLIMLVIAAIMAAMQKVTMAINVAIAAIILFGGGYVMLLIYDGLK